MSAARDLAGLGRAQEIRARVDAARLEVADLLASPHLRGETRAAARLRAWLRVAVVLEPGDAYAGWWRAYSEFHHATAEALALAEGGDGEAVTLIQLLRYRAGFDHATAGGAAWLAEQRQLVIPGA